MLQTLKKHLINAMTANNYPRFFAAAAARLTQACDADPFTQLARKPTPGNAMTLLTTNDETRHACFELIRSAADHINIETLIFDTDADQPEQTGRFFADLLAEKAKQGVQVNLIVDALAQKHWSSPDVLAGLVRAGAAIRYYMPRIHNLRLRKYFHRTHKKILVADGRRALIGGSNFGYRYLGRRQWRDTNVLLTGPVVADLQRQFLTDWRNLGPTAECCARYFPPLQPAGDLTLYSLDQRPAEKCYEINTAVLLALRAAKSRVILQTPYFNPPDWLARPLTRAARRGVDVRILTNADSANNVHGAYPIAASWFRKMTDAGSRVCLWNHPRRTMHAKALVVDDSFAILGSTNFNHRSSFWDAENAILLTQPSAVAQIDAMLQTDFTAAHVFPVTPAWLNAHPAHIRSQWNFAQVQKWLF